MNGQTGPHVLRHVALDGQLVNEFVKMDFLVMMVAMDSLLKVDHATLL